MQLLFRAQVHAPVGTPGRDQLPLPHAESTPGGSKAGEGLQTRLNSSISGLEVNPTQSLSGRDWGQSARPTAPCSQLHLTWLGWRWSMIQDFAGRARLAPKLLTARVAGSSLARLLNVHAAAKVRFISLVSPGLWDAWAQASCWF